MRGTRVNILYIKLYLSTYIYFKFTMHYTHWQQQNLCSLNDIPFKLSNGECCGIGFKLRNFYRGIQNNKIYILLAFLINKIQYILFYDVCSLNTLVNIKVSNLLLIHRSILITKVIRYGINLIFDKGTLNHVFDQHTCLVFIYIKRCNNLYYLAKSAIT